MSFLQKIIEYTNNSIVDEILLFAIIIAIVEAIAQNNIKNSDHTSFKFIIGLGFYMLVGYLLHYAYHKYPLSKLNVIWSCMSIIFAMVTGYLLYDEPFNYWTVLAIFLAISAIICAFKSNQ